MATYNDRRLTRIEQRDQRAGVIPGPEYQAFQFIDDPEGADKCQKENPNAVVVLINFIDPDICEHRPCKNPDCNCPQKLSPAASRAKGESRLNQSGSRL